MKSRGALRAWLKANHNQSEGIWLVTYKKTAGRSYLPYDDIVEEALAFGWVDSLPRVLDEERSMRRLSPRKPGSTSSLANRGRIDKLLAAGLMHPAGLAKVELAKRNGNWRRTSAAESGRLPANLAKALSANPIAKRNFDSFPPSSKRIILEWINSAKGPDARAADR